MRIAAAALAMLTFSAAGASRSKGMELRERLLTEFMRDIARLSMEVEHRPRDLGSIAATLTEGETADFWRRFSELLSSSEDAEGAWRRAVESSRASTTLSREERAALVRVGEGLGVQGRIRQLGGFSRAAEELNGLLASLRRERERKGALYTKLGLLMGAAAALLII